MPAKWWFKQIFTASLTAWVLILIIISFASIPLWAHDSNHDHDDWFKTLMQPDVPAASCCGTADAYWCDDYYARGDKAYCKITDTQDDALLNNREHVPVGTEIEIPENKLMEGKKIGGNPTGHAIVFLSRNRYVFCFVQTSAI